MSQQITISKYEYDQLVKKSKMGWKAFFILRDRMDELIEYRDELEVCIIEMKKETKEQEENKTIDDYCFLKKKFIEMFEKLGELTDCPICFEGLLKSESVVLNCGHIICKSCKEKLTKKECPICRSKFY